MKMSSKIMGPYGRIRARKSRQDGGKKKSAILSPSKGAKGIKLKSIKIKLM
jgi:hypothetical protein